MTAQRSARLALLAVFSVIGCSRTDIFAQLTAPTTTSARQIAVTPGAVSVGLGQSIQFGATVTPAQSDDSIVWTVVGAGTIDSHGLYVAPSQFPDATTTELTDSVVATLTSNPKITGTGTVTVTPASYGPPVTLEKVSGDLQTVTVAQGLLSPLVVKVVDANGTGVPNISVHFSSPFGDAETVTQITGSDGTAEASPRAGKKAGAQTFQVVAGTLTPVTFTATAVADALASVRATHPNPKGLAGTTLTDPLTLTFADQYGNPIQGESATTLTPAGALVTPNAPQSDANGVILFKIHLAAQIGPQTFSFTDVNTPTFTTSIEFTATSGLASVIVAFAGDQQSGTAGTALGGPLVARVLDSNGIPVVGYAVTWSTTDGALSGQTSVTDANGNVTANYTLSTRAGTNRVTVNAGTITGSPLTFSALSLAGPASKIALVSGDGQTAQAGQAFGNAFTVRVTDKYGNPVSGKLVQFGAQATGATITPNVFTTGTDGLAQAKMTAGTVAGSEVFAAAAFDTTNAPLAGSPVLVNLTVTGGGTLYHLTVVSGGGQSGTVSTQLTKALQVKLTSGATPVAGQKITFGVALGDGVVAQAIVTTDANGLAQTTVKLGATPGAQRFSASIATADNSPVYFDETALAPGAVTLVAVSGGGQTGNINSVLSQPLVVEALDASGNPVAGVSVTLKPTSVGQVTPAVATTDASGRATFVVTLGATLGDQVFAATNGVSTATFHETASSVTAGQRLVIVSGNGQSAAVGFVLPQPLIVRVTNDGGGPIAGVKISWTSDQPDSNLSSTSAVTDANGYAQITATLGLTAGKQQFTASAVNTSGSPATFSMTATPAVPAAITLVSGDGQTAAVGTLLGQPLVVKVTDQLGHGVKGATVKWSTNSGAILSSTVTTTDADGLAQIKVTLGTVVGLEQITADAGPITNSPITFRAVGTPGPATKLILIAGDGQTTGAGQAFPGAFSVQAVDTFSNPVSGIAVHFATSTNGATVSPADTTTDTGGLAQTTMKAGPTAVPQVYTASAGTNMNVITITNTAVVSSATMHLILVLGDAQTGAAGTKLPQQLVVKVVAAGTNLAVAGQTVTFAVALGNGSVVNQTVVSDSTGQASTFATLGTTAGAQRFSAALPAADNSPLYFNETATSTSGGVAVLRIVSGNGQTSNPGATLAQPLVVQALDTNGAPVANAKVNFDTTSGGHVSQGVVQTDAQGMASVTATLGAAAGDQIFTATSASATATFHETASTTTTGKVLVIVSGSGQTGTAGSALAQPLVVRVTNSGGAPQSGVTVTWKAVSAGAQVSTGSSTTDAQGLAMVNATLGPTAGTQSFIALVTGASGSPATFTENVRAAPASRLIIVGGDGQSGKAGTALAQLLVVQVTDASGNPVAGVTVTFAAGTGGGTISASSTTSDANGQVSAKVVLAATSGIETFIATSPGLSGSPATFTATATADVDHISISPQNVTIQTGGSQRYVATAVYVDGTSSIITASATWGSSNAGVVSLAAGGIATAVAPGNAFVQATYGGKTGQTPVTVAASKLVSIVVTPAGQTMATGTTHQFTATGQFSDGTVSDLTDVVTWQTSDAAIATVGATTNRGLVSAVGAGTATITASYQGLNGSRTVVVAKAALVALEITPLNVVGTVGSGQVFRATATYGDGTVQDVTTAAQWSTSDASLMTLQNAPAQAGRATFIGAGTPNVIATYSGKTATVKVTITKAKIVSLVVNPGTVTLSINDIFQLRATATYDDGTVADVTSLAVWTSSNTAVADVSNAPANRGTISAISAGSAKITATLDGQTATHTVTVNNQTVNRIAVYQPGGGGGPGGGIPNFGPFACTVGTTIRLQAGALYTGGGQPRIADISDQVAWTTSDASLAVVGQGATNGGFVQCLAAGTVTIAIAWEGMTGDAQVDISGSTLQSITIAPLTASLIVGDQRALHATGNYSGNPSTRDLTATGTWTSSDPSVATVSNAAGYQGQVTAVGPGSAAITFSYQGMTGTAKITVSSATLTNVIVSPANASVQLPRRGQGSQQFNATALYSDGSTQDVTQLAAWTSSVSTVATISNQAPNQGRTTLISRGVTTINAKYNNVTGSTDLTVY